MELGPVEKAVKGFLVLFAQNFAKLLTPVGVVLYGSQYREDYELWICLRGED
jgi:hypothetical protein